MIYGAWGVALIEDWLVGKTVKAMLVDSTYVQAVDDTLSDATACEASGTGYTAGGIDVTSLISVSLDVPTQAVQFLCDPIDFGTVTITDVAGIVLYAGTVPIAADLFGGNSITAANFTYEPLPGGLIANVIA